MKKARVAGAAVLLCTCFGTGLVAIRVGVSHLPPLSFTMLRLGLIVCAFLLLLAFARRTVRRDGHFLRNLVLVGVLNVGLPYMLSAQALRLVSSTLLSILMNMIPVFTVLLAHFFVPGERLTPRTGLGVLAAVAGASIVVWAGAGAPGAVASPGALGLGVVLIVANALSVSVSNILLRMRLHGEDGLVVTGGQMTVGLLVVVPFALLLEGAPRLGGVAWQGWAAAAWAGLIGAFVGYGLSFLMIQRWGVTTTAISSTGVPLVTALAGALLLDERLTVMMALGGILLIAGVLGVILGAQADLRIRSGPGT